jgi:hypothetical protein
MREFDVSSVERKFYDCIVPVDFKEESTTPPKRGFAHITGVSAVDDGALIHGNWVNGKKPFEAFTPTDTSLALQRWPQVSLKYWLPKARIYKVRDCMDHCMVYRKPGRFFRVGLNNQAFVVREIRSGLSYGCHNLDLDAPLMSPKIWSENLFVNDNSLFYNGMPIGVFTGTKLFLDDKSLLKLIPQSKRETWQIVY